MCVCYFEWEGERGKDWRTAWFRVRGRNFGQQIGFAEKVLYKLPTKGPQAPANMDARQADGILLGSSRTSNTYTIGLGAGITSVRSITRLPLNDGALPL